MIGDECNTRAGVQFGKNCVVGNLFLAGTHFKLGDFSRVKSNATFGMCSSIGRGCFIGQNAQFLQSAVIQDLCTLKSGANISHGATIGNGCNIELPARLEDKDMLAFMTLGNLDGSGRQVLLVKHAGGVTIRAGCFIGTAEGFCKRAALEHELVYVNVVNAIIKVW